MKRGRGAQEDTPDHPFAPGVPWWRLWLTRVVTFVLLFTVLLTVLSFLSGIVERFFITLYTN